MLWQSVRAQEKEEKRRSEAGTPFRKTREGGGGNVGGVAAGLVALFLGGFAHESAGSQEIFMVEGAQG